MKTLFFTYFLCLYCLRGLMSANASQVDIRSELTKAELASLAKRELVLKLKDVENSPWPEVTYYALIVAKPLEAIALFSAYDIQKDYIPNLIKSMPIKHITATDVQTEYELKIPFPLSNAHYIHGARIQRFYDDYQSTWYMVKSTSANQVSGSAYFTNENGMTLLRYRSFVVPKSIFGSLVKKLMLKDVEQSLLKIREFIETKKKEQPELVTKYSEFILKALSGEFVYQNIIEQK